MVVAAAARGGLFEHRVLQPHLGQVAGGAARGLERGAAALDLRALLLGRRLHVAQLGEPRERLRRLLRRGVDGHRGDVADRELAHDAVAVEVAELIAARDSPHQLFGLHAHGAGGGRHGVEAHGGDAALPSHRPHHQIGVDAFELRAVELHRARRVGGRDQRSVGDALRLELALDRLAGRFLGVGRGGVTRARAGPR